MSYLLLDSDAEAPANGGGGGSGRRRGGAAKWFRSFTVMLIALVRAYWG